MQEEKDALRVASLEDWWRFALCAARSAEMKKTALGVVRLIGSADDCMAKALILCGSRRGRVPEHENGYGTASPE